MTQLTDRGPSLSSRGYSASRDTSAVGQAFFSGVVAACLGLGAIAVVVLALWIGSPYAGSGPSGALHVAADLWLLAHGAELARPQSVGGGSAPIGLNPLLISALPLWLLHRAARHALEPPEPVFGGSALTAPPAVLALSTPPLVPRRAIAWVTGGYLLVGLAAVVYAAEGPVRVQPLGALLHLPVVTVAVVAAGAWTGSGRPYVLLPTAVRRLLTTLPVPGGVRLARSLHAPDWLTPRRLSAALRATGAGMLALIGTGALLTVVSLAGHAGAVHASFAQLTGAWSGRLAVLVLSLVLLPNAVVWAGIYGLGPGFTIGAGSTVAPLAMTGYPELPRFPLLAALPDEHPDGTVLHWLLAGLVPLAVGLSVAWFVSSAALRPVPRVRIPHTRAEPADPPGPPPDRPGTVPGPSPEPPGRAGAGRGRTAAAAGGAAEARGRAVGEDGPPGQPAPPAHSRRPGRSGRLSRAVRRAVRPRPSGATGTVRTPWARRCLRALTPCWLSRSLRAARRYLGGASEYTSAEGAAKPWNHRETAVTAALAACGCGLAAALLAGVSGGPLGARALADFGPSWWQAGGAALGWSALIGVPGALALRWFRLVHRAARRRAEAAAAAAGTAPPPTGLRRLTASAPWRRLCGTLRRTGRRTARAVTPRRRRPRRAAPRVASGKPPAEAARAPEVPGPFLPDEPDVDRWTEPEPDPRPGPEVAGDPDPAVGPPGYDYREGPVPGLRVEGTVARLRSRMGPVRGPAADPPVFADPADSPEWSERAEWPGGAEPADERWADDEDPWAGAGEPGREWADQPRFPRGPAAEPPEADRPGGGM